MCLAALLWSTAGSAEAVPSTATVALNGSDADGPLSGNVDVIIRIFDTNSAGTLIFEETQTTIASDGLMYVELGRNGGALDASVFDGSDRWVEVAVNGTTMSPRLKVGVVPYAVAAASADTAEMLGDKRAEDFSPADHDHAGTYLPAGSTLACPSGFVTGINNTTGDVICGTSMGTTYDAAVNGGLVLDASNDFSIATDGITAAHLATNSVGSSEVINNSLTAGDLAANSVGSSEVTDNSLTASDLAANSVGSSEVVDGSLTAIDLASSSVDSSEIATDAVRASEIAANAVGASEIAANSVGASERTHGSTSEISSTCGVFVAATTCPAGDEANGCGGGMIDCDQGPASGGFCEYDSGCTGLSGALDNCGDCDIYVRLR